MATSPHQPEQLADKITRLKDELATYRSARDQILVLGQSTSGGGVATTHAELKRIEDQIAWREAQIAALTDQLNGDSDNLAPGMNEVRSVSGYD
jgi:pyrimidine operon attenuation protein/uracil phosphoribosyltransferase